MSFICYLGATLTIMKQWVSYYWVDFYREKSLLIMLRKFISEEQERFSKTLPTVLDISHIRAKNIFFELVATGTYKLFRESIYMCD